MNNYDPSGGGGVTRQSFQAINAKEKQQVADLKTSPIDDPDKEAAIARLESDKTIAVSSAKAALKDLPADKLNIAAQAYDGDGDQQLDEAEFEAMQAMLMNPNMSAYEATIHEIYKANGRKDGADGAGMGSWMKRAMELEKAGLSPAQIKEALTVEIQNVAGVEGAPPGPGPNHKPGAAY